MAEDVYAVPDLTKKVRYRREREQETEDRGEREERVVDIYASADNPDPGTQQDAVQQLTAQQQHGASDESRKNNGFKAAAVCLGVLCVILLAGITGLGVHNSKLIKENNKLTNLTKDLDQMTKQKDDLQSRYDNVTAQKDKIQSGYDHLQSKYNNLTKDLDQMTKDLFQMTKQKDECQSRCNIITTERDELNRKLSLCVIPEWKIIGSSYYISTEEKTWDESRRWCIDKQSHLIIINSKEEQDFVNSVVNWNQNMWLGLTERRGVWKWVDGTAQTEHSTYWRRGEPSNGKGEDCAVHHKGYRSGPQSGWNDVPCTGAMRWICEKVLN